MKTTSTRQRPNACSNKSHTERAGLAKRHRFSVESGDLLWLDGHWYVTHSGLIRLARRCHCAGIHVEPVAQFSDPATSRWAFKATVYKSRACRGFVGYGDADPSNVSPVVHGAEMRVAETVQLTGRYARPTVSASARSRKSVPLQSSILTANRRCGRHNLQTEIMAVRRFEIGYASSFASTSLTQHW